MMYFNGIAGSKTGKVHVDDIHITHYIDKASTQMMGLGDVQIVIPTGGSDPLPAPPPLMPADWCAGLTPGWQCPQYALRNAVVGSAVGAAFGGFMGRGQSTTVGAMAGAAFFGLVSWYLFSGRWWV